ASDSDAAATLARQLEAHNASRRVIEQSVTRAALERAATQCRSGKPAALVLSSPEWHPGVVGISAARVVDRFAVPTAVIGFQNGMGRGSVRTPPGIDVKAALDAASDLLVRYGGHREAAGFSIEPDRVDAFRERFTHAIARQERGGDDRGLVLDALLD